TIDDNVPENFRSRGDIAYRKRERIDLAAAAFEFDINRAVEIGKSLEGFLERRNVFAREFRIEPASVIDAAKLRRRHIGKHVAYTGGSNKIRIVNNNRNAVP